MQIKDVLLLGNRKGNFEIANNSKSRLDLNEDIRDIAVVNLANEEKNNFLRKEQCST